MLEEKKRLKESKWKQWGPYLSDRQWGTVREDYSADGNAWAYLPHDHARSRAYRWGEEGIGGISDINQLLCFAPAFWNGKDAILKERLFGLTGPEGNHGEDVKEYYYYLDNTPSHSWMKMLYKYPQQAFPYEKLVEENGKRSKDDPEYELIDTSIFDQNRYFDIYISYAKAGPEDILIEIKAVNHGPKSAVLHLLPTLWFRNNWVYRYGTVKPFIRQESPRTIICQHPHLPEMALYTEKKPKEVLFCDNETNRHRLFGEPKAEAYTKDGINDYLINEADSVNPNNTGSKASFHYALRIESGKDAAIRLRLGPSGMMAPFADFEKIFSLRHKEAEDFYAVLQTKVKDADEKNIQRQAWAGMLWSKQFYYYDVPQWLNGDPVYPPPPPERRKGRNREWLHLNNADIISMPDKWEYPWYAAWDLAFHCLSLAMLDADFAKNQLLLLTKEWYMHPNGQLPAYEWNFSDVNPPVHAWASWRVYEMEKEKNGGKGDRAFLEEVFHKLMLNFTWWVNRKDHEDNNIFQGGFLGLDNIGVFDRSAPLPTGGNLEQADGTSWMAMYSLNLMRISLELANENPVYQQMATKFFEHFLYIAGAMANVGNIGIDLWDEEDGFFYDVLSMPSGEKIDLKVRSLVGLTTLFATEVIDHELLETHKDFAQRLNWFLNYRPDLAGLVSRWYETGKGATHLLSLLRGHRMKLLLRRMLDETEFLSTYGVRALSKYHEEHPYVFIADQEEYTVKYQPAESDSDMFGGNSNWRGPVWFPMNYLIIESLYNFHNYYGDDFLVEYPTGSGQMMSLKQIALELSRRLIRIFKKDRNGRRAVFGDQKHFQDNEHFRDHLLFYEYFHGDNGSGLGAAHQTGWTGLIANLISQVSETEDV